MVCSLHLSRRSGKNVSSQKRLKVSLFLASRIFFCAASSSSAFFSLRVLTLPSLQLRSNSNEFDLHIDKVNYGLSSYITAFILLQLVKRITESKDFFTEHSNETMFSMLAKYREKADVDSQAIATAQGEIKKVHKQLKQAQDQLELLLKDKLVNKEKELIHLPTVS